MSTGTGWGSAFGGTRLGYSFCRLCTIPLSGWCTALGSQSTGSIATRTRRSHPIGARTHYPSEPCPLLDTWGNIGVVSCRPQQAVFWATREAQMTPEPTPVPLQLGQSWIVTRGGDQLGALGLLACKAHYNNWGFPYRTIPHGTSVRIVSIATGCDPVQYQAIVAGFQDSVTGTDRLWFTRSQLRQ